MREIKMPTYDLTGKTALVTGAGSGIGQAAAVELAHYGARVSVADVSADAARETAEYILGRGGAALAVAADVSDPEQVEDMTARTVEAFGGLDILISNAGVGGRVLPLLEQEPEDLDQVYQVNLKGAFLCGRAAARQMLRQHRGGRMIFTSSIASVEGGGFHGPYGATKGGLCTLVRTMAAEWAPAGITVNAVCPGLTSTAINREVEADPELKARLLSHIPLGRMALPEEIASLMLYLASDAAGFITGASFVADGGATVGGI